MRDGIVSIAAPAHDRTLIWYWGRRGGGATFTLRLARHLIDQLGPENVAVAIASENEHRSDFEDLGAELITTPAAWALDLSPMERLRRLRGHLRFSKALTRPGFGTVIVTMNFPLAWPFVYSLAGSATRLIYVAHDALPHAGDYMRLWQSLSQRALMRRADIIVALSTSVADQLRVRFARVRVPVKAEVVAIPLESVFPRKFHRAKRRGGGRPLRFLFLGRLLTYKGLGLLCDAIGKLGERQDWSLTVAGTGPLEDFCRERFGVHPRCRTELGWLPRERFVEILDEHDVLLCPYLEASQSGVIPEALARGLAVIATPVDGLPEQVGFGRFGLIADRVNATAFTREMCRVLDDPALLGHLTAIGLDVAQENTQGNGWLSVIAS